MDRRTVVEVEDEVEPGQEEVMLDEVVVVDLAEVVVVVTGVEVVGTEEEVVDLAVVVDSVEEEEVDSPHPLLEVPVGGRCKR